MFFAIDLLCPQHGGKFSLAWICATRGVYAFRRKQIVECDVIGLCNNIQEMISFESNRPKRRLSLALAARLIHGTAKIHREQVKALQDDIIQFLVLIRKPQFATELDVSSQPMPVAKVPKKRKKRFIPLEDNSLAVQQPVFIDEELQNIVNDAEVEIAVETVTLYEDNITMREVPSTTTLFLDAVRGEGEFGLIEDAETPMYPEIASKDLTIPLPAQQQDVPKTPTKRKSVRSTAQGVSKRMATRQTEVEEITVVAEPTLPAPIPDIVVENEPLVPEPAVSVPAPAVSVPAPPVTVREVTPPKEPSPKVKKTKEANLIKTLIKVKPQRTINIDRISIYELEVFDMWSYKNIVPIEVLKPKFEDTVSVRLLSGLIEDNTDVENLLSTLRASPRCRTSILKSYGSLHMETIQSRSQTVQVTVTPKPHEIVVPVEVHPIPTKRRRTQEPVPRIEMPNINETVIPPPPQDIDVHTTVIQEEPVLRIEMPDISETVMPPPPPQNIDVHTTVIAEEPVIAVPPLEATILIETAPVARAPAMTREPFSIDDKHRRLKRIKQIVKHWDIEQQGPITITDICNKPIHRLHIAIAFNDLLVLHKMKYVTLINKHDSLELDHIEKGPNLIKEK